MKIIIDECLPKKIVQIFVEHEVQTIPQIGLAGTNDGYLLDELDLRDVDIFVTMDGNIEYQQRFYERKFGTIIIRSVTNRLEDLLHLEEELSDAIKKVEPGKILRIPTS